MSAGRTAAWLAGVVALAGCATRADLLAQDKRLRGLIMDQRRQLQAVQRELERLRGDLEGGGGTRSGSRPGDDRVAQLEQRLAELEGKGSPLPPPGAEEAAPAVPSTPPPVAGRPPAAAPAPEVDDAWRREVAREQAAAGAVNVPERGDYLALLDGVARQDCARVVPQLNSFAAGHKESPLADNALYWAARCYEEKGRQEDAISKFYEVGTRYPKGDKAPAALWAQANLFLDMGNTPDARIVFAKLIREYPGSEEAAKARQKVTELAN